MSLNLHHQVDFGGWTEALQKAARQVENMQQAWEQVGNHAVALVQRNFQASGGPAMEPWPPLAPATLAARARVLESMGKLRSKSGKNKGAILRSAAAKIGFGGVAKPLIFTGRLLRSIRRVATPSYVDVGSSLVQACRLFFGSKSPTQWGHGPMVSTPARNPFGFTAQDYADFRLILLMHLLGPITRGLH